MTTLTSQKTLFSVDPTEGFVQYAQTIKPYHSKILEVLVEYIYTENINVTLKEKVKWKFDISHPLIDVVHSYGFGAIWDAPYVVNEYPVVKIKKAVGDTPIEVMCYNDTLNPTEILISYNPDKYIINVNDPITFQTTGTLPSTTLNIISPGKVYYITSINSNIIEVSDTILGIPLIFTTSGTGTIKIHQENLHYNSFLVEHREPTEFQCIAFNLKSNQFAFINNYTIIGVNPSLRHWTIPGIHIVGAIPGTTIYIHNNAEGIDGPYTIQSVVTVSGNTVITTVEPIPITAGIHGSLNIQDDFGLIPNWMTGTSVKVSSPGVLPYPLNSTSIYYFIPSKTAGCFNLSIRQTPTSALDIINLSNLGTSYINIERTDLFYPGAVVKVSGTYLLRNEGTYYIRSVVDEGSYLRVNVMQKVSRSTPSTIPYDGIMKLDMLYGYDYPNYGITIQAPDLYFDTFIDERLTFEFVDERLPFEFVVNLNREMSSLSEGNKSISKVKELDILYIFTGFDTQLFDIGVLY